MIRCVCGHLLEEHEFIGEDHDGNEVLACTVESCPCELLEVPGDG